MGYLKGIERGEWRVTSRRVEGIHAGIRRLPVLSLSLPKINVKWGRGPSPSGRCPGDDPLTLHRAYARLSVGMSPSSLISNLAARPA